MKKKIILIGIIVILLVVGCVIYFSSKEKVVFTNDLPGNYICVFHGGVGKQTYETYVYYYKDEKWGSMYKYINVTNTNVSNESSGWKYVITKEGTVDTTDKVFMVAKENRAYSYVTLPNDDKTYSIEEYERMFIVN